MIAHQSVFVLYSQDSSAADVKDETDKNLEIKFEFSFQDMHKKMHRSLTAKLDNGSSQKQVCVHQKLIN